MRPCERLSCHLGARAEAAARATQTVLGRTLRYVAAWPGVVAASAAAAAGYAATLATRETFAVGMEASSPLVLPRGWNKQAIVYIGETPVSCIFDSGSFRNAINDRALGKLCADETSRSALTGRLPTPETSISGITGDVKGGYDEVVGIEVTFRTEGREHKQRVLCVVLGKPPGEPMDVDFILGCPTLDLLGFACAPRCVELRAIDMELPTLEDLTADPVPAQEYAACLDKPVTVQPAEVKEVTLATLAVRQEGLYVAAGPDCPANLLVAEGPAKVENGRVKVFLATRDGEALQLSPFTRIATLRQSGAEDRELQALLQEARDGALRADLEAFDPRERVALLCPDGAPAEPVMKAGSTSYTKRSVDRVAMIPNMLK